MLKIICFFEEISTYSKHRNEMTQIVQTIWDEMVGSSSATGPESGLVCGRRCSVGSSLVMKADGSAVKGIGVPRTYVSRHFI